MASGRGLAARRALAGGGLRARWRGWRVVVRYGRLRLGLPHALEAVELANARQHHVHDDVLQVDEHPFAFARAFDAERPESGFLGFLDDAVGDGAHVAVG